MYKKQMWICITTGHIMTELAPHTYLYHIYSEDLESIEIRLRWVGQSVKAKKRLKDDPYQCFKYINEETESPGGLWVWSRARLQQKLTEPADLVCSLCSASCVYFLKNFLNYFEDYSGTQFSHLCNVSWKTDNDKDEILSFGTICMDLEVLC